MRIKAKQMGKKKKKSKEGKEWEMSPSTGKWGLIARLWNWEDIDFYRERERKKRIMMRSLEISSVIFISFTSWGFSNIILAVKPSKFFRWHDTEGRPNIICQFVRTYQVFLFLFYFLGKRTCRVEDPNEEDCPITRTLCWELSIPTGLANICNVHSCVEQIAKNLRKFECLFIWIWVKIVDFWWTLD